MAYPRLDSHGLTTMLTRLASVIRQGHTIKSDDATMTQRKNLKIIGATVTDNALADQTEVRFPNGGHTIISSSMLPIGGSTLPMAGRDNLQFGSKHDPIFTEDDPTNNKTIVHGQLFICDSESDWNTLSDEAFKAKYGADREQVGVYWYLPWANSIAYQTDLTPIGTVLSLAVDTTNTTLFPADLVEFPNKDYVICRGATVKITDYPALYQYLEDEYGDGNYFGTSQTAEGYFVLPNWSADFPTNGVLVIKARITSDVITFAEVDETGISSRTDEVPSCARVAGIEEDIDDLEQKTKIPLALLGSGDNLNNLTENGWYYIIGSTPTNAPANVKYSPIFHVMGRSDTGEQMIISGGTIYLRQYANGWGSWYRINGSAV